MNNDLYLWSTQAGHDSSNKRRRNNYPTTFTLSNVTLSCQKSFDGLGAVSRRSTNTPSSINDAISVANANSPQLVPRLPLLWVIVSAGA